MVAEAKIAHPEAGATAEKYGSAWRAARLSWGLLDRSEKRRGMMIGVAIMLASLLDTISLVGVMPLVSLIIEPAVLTTNSVIRTLHELVGAPGYDNLVKLVAAGAIGLLAISLSVNYLVMEWSKRFRIACQNRLAKELMSRCVGAPYEWLLRQSSTKLAHHVFNDVLSWSSGGINGTISIVGQASLLTLVTIVVLSATVLGGMIGMLIVVALAMTIMLLIRSRVRRLSEFRRVASAQAFSFASEFLGGIKDVKLSGREPAFVRIYGDSFDTYGSTMGNLKLLQAIPPLAMLFLGQSGIILIALVLWKVGRSSGEIAAEMALVLLVTARVIPAVTRIAGEFGNMWNVIPNIEGIISLMRQLPPLADRSNKASLGAPETDWGTWRRLELDNVGYQYSSERGVAIQGVSVTIERGKSYGIAGPTGAGKTTLVDLMLGLLHPTSGNIQVDGTVLSAANAGAWQKKIGYVPQAPLIADDTLLANVAFGVPANEVDEDHAVFCLQSANLGEVLESVSLRGPLGERGNRLSGGQRQRVAIARALYDKPDILVLDEATSALDTMSERAVLEALDNLHGKITTITVAHRLSTIERCDEVLVLNRGRLVANGPYETLMRTNDLFSSMSAASGNGGRSVGLR